MTALLNKPTLTQHLAICWQTLKPIFCREIMAYFRSPVAYVFMVIFLVASVGCTWYLGNFYETGQATLQNFLFFHPWLYLIFIPSVGMRLWSEELRSGAVELLLTLPTPLGVAVLAKFLAAWVFIGLTLLCTFPMVITVFILGNPDGGAIITGYLGSFLMAGAYLAVSCFTSAFTNNQVVSFITSFMANLLLVILGWGVLTRTLVEVFPARIATLISAFSYTTHFNALRNGVVDVRDVFYFLSIIAVMLLANIVVIERSKTA